MTAETLATGKCGECGHDRAQLKMTARGAPYRYCPVCRAQYFPRRADAQERLCRAFGVDPVVIDGAPESSRVAKKGGLTPPAAHVRDDGATRKKGGGWLNEW